MLWPFSVSKWESWLLRVQPDGTRDAVPMDKLLRWMQLESGGNACAVGRVGGADDDYPGHVYEAGLAQTYFDTPDTVKYGVTSDELRVDCSGTAMPTFSSDDRRLLHARVHLETVKEHRARARQRLALNGAALAESSIDFWCFVKLVHAAPALFDYLAPAKRALGHVPSWRQFKGYVNGLGYDSLYAINRGIAGRVFQNGTRSSFLDRVWNNCEEFAGGDGGFISWELELLLAITAIAIVLSRYVL